MRLYNSETIITAKRSPSEIGSSSVPPLLEVPPDRRRRGIEPVARSFFEIGPQSGGAGRPSGMDRCEIESHRLKKAGLETPAGAVAKLDFPGIRGDAPEDESVSDFEKRIRSAVLAVRQF